MLLRLCHDCDTKPVLAAKTDIFEELRLLILWNLLKVLTHFEVTGGFDSANFSQGQSRFRTRRISPEPISPWMAVRTLGFPDLSQPRLEIGARSSGTGAYTPLMYHQEVTTSDLPGAHPFTRDENSLRMLLLAPRL